MASEDAAIGFHRCSQFALTRQPVAFGDEAGLDASLYLPFAFVQRVSAAAGRGLINKPAATIANSVRTVFLALMLDIIS